MENLVSAEARSSLDRARIIQGAVALADQIGLEPLTMRRLAEHLKTKPMTLYHYVKNKEDILTGMVGYVFDEVERPDVELGWKEAITQRAQSFRLALTRHPWALPIIESQTQPGPNILDHHEAVLSAWMRSGLPLPLIAHGVAISDAFVFGFVLQETTLPLGGEEELGGNLDEASREIIAPLAPEKYPALTRFTAEHVMQPGYDFGDSFDVGLRFILDGIERLDRQTNQDQQAAE
ncbi:TetR family transcriptional regulator [Pontimonas salivibrio]|uniref:TetR family transcriptional regulator n=1 Tax=Pontimonas salivibrio TaxID=1159327 RepID=A0A2L2BNL6_9MICO|nr:TetR/AcrR family transcriptional regulator [Pontimonas salivibrio]AVG23237.1 TetR family transcriptional regulator [Pontimonas salivibrio]